MSNGEKFGIPLRILLVLIAIATYTWWKSPERTALEARLTASTAAPSTAEPTPEDMLPPPAMLRPAAAPTPVIANPDELAGLVMRFYRDIDASQKSPVFDVEAITTDHFLKANHDRWTRDYGFVDHARTQISSVHGDNVDYTVDYDYIGNTGIKLLWERAGTWSFIHGSRGWLLDSDSWSAIHIVGFVLKDGTQLSTQDRVFSDGRHTFDLPGYGTYKFTPSKDGWSVAAAPTPEPVAPPDDASAPRPEYAPAAPPAAGYAPAPAPQADCEAVGVNGVYHDGEVLELDDGRYLRVADYDTSTSSGWVAPFDALICDGDKVINKDDNDSVDLQQ